MSKASNPSSGFSLIEAMISILILGIFTLGAMSIGTILLKQQTQSNVTFQADTFQRTLMAVINNKDAWTNTTQLARNQSSLKCLNAKNIPNLPCTGAGGDIPVIQDAAGNPFYPSNSSNSPDQGTVGLTAQGQACVGFSPVEGQGSDLCPLKFLVSWSATCPTGSCDLTNVQPMITIKALYNPKSPSKKIAFNPGNYGKSFSQGSSPCGFHFDNALSPSTDNIIWENCGNHVGINTKDIGNVPNQEQLAALAINMTGDNRSPLLMSRNGSPFFTMKPIGPPASSGWALLDHGDVLGNTQWNYGFYMHHGRIQIGNNQTDNRDAPDPATSLDVRGSGITTTSLTYSNIAQTSDERLKTKVEPLTEGLEHLRSLRPITFHWNKTAKKARGVTDDDRHLGLLAQQVEKIFPELVKTATDGYKSVDYVSLIAPVIMAVQQVDAENAALKLKNEDLEKRLQRLEKLSPGKAP